MFARLPQRGPSSRELAEARFLADRRPGRLMLWTGVFQDARGRSPVLDCVRRAQQALLRGEATKDYTPFEGDPGFLEAVRTLALGRVLARRASGVQAPGGTGALRLAGEFLKGDLGVSRIWVSSPTWDNHLAVLGAAGLETPRYPYARDRRGGVDAAALEKALARIPRGDALLLQACCHNPVGADPTPPQWRRLAALCRRRGLLPVLDVAFLGYARGVAADLAGLRTVCAAVPESLVALSLSKSFEIYRDRVGAVLAVARSREEARRAFGALRLRARAAYSRPPAHGALVVARILGDRRLRAAWLRDVGAIRGRLRRMRRLLARGLPETAARGLVGERGLFTRLPLSRGQAAWLERERAIYVSPGGGLNVSALPEARVPAFCAAVAEALDRA